AVDARIESGRTPIHALERLWSSERFDRIVVPAPVGRGRGFTPADLIWILGHAPSETLILRPDPAPKPAPEQEELGPAPVARYCAQRAPRPVARISSST